MQYITKGTCSTEINFEVENNKITEISFTGGCSGNLQGICSLVKGMNIDDVISKLEGIKCGFKGKFNTFHIDNNSSKFDLINKIKNMFK